jgi:hypothetical protein
VRCSPPRAAKRARTTLVTPLTQRPDGRLKHGGLGRRRSTARDAGRRHARFRNCVSGPSLCEVVGPHLSARASHTSPRHLVPPSTGGSGRPASIPALLMQHAVCGPIVSKKVTNHSPALGDPHPPAPNTGCRRRARVPARRSPRHDSFRPRSEPAVASPSSATPPTEDPAVAWRAPHVAAVLGLGAYAVVLIRRRGQSESPWKPTTTLVTQGPFRIGRVVVHP